MKNLPQFINHARNLVLGTPVLISQGQHSIPKEKGAATIKKTPKDKTIKESIENKTAWTGWNQHVMKGDISNKNWNSDIVQHHTGEIDYNGVVRGNKVSHHPYIRGMIRNNIERDKYTPGNPGDAIHDLIDGIPELHKHIPNYDLGVEIARKFDANKLHLDYYDLNSGEYVAAAKKRDAAGARLRTSLLGHELNSNSKSSLKNLAEEHKNLLLNYTVGSSVLNSTLFDNHRENRNNPKSIARFNLQKMDEAIDRMKLPHDMTLMSGVKFHPGDEAAKNPYNRIYLPAYTSTSIERNIPHQFSVPLNIPENSLQRTIKGGISSFSLFNNGTRESHVIHFHLPKGHPGAYVENLTANPDEEEVILPRGLSFHIDPTPITHHWKPYGYEKHGILDKVSIWHAHPVKAEPDAVMDRKREIDADKFLNYKS